MEKKTPKEWMSARGAALRIGTSIYNVQKMALSGLIATRAEPGQSVKFSARDVERLAAERGRLAAP